MSTLKCTVQYCTPLQLVNHPWTTAGDQPSWTCGVAGWLDSPTTLITPATFTAKGAIVKKMALRASILIPAYNNIMLRHPTDCRSQRTEGRRPEGMKSVCPNKLWKVAPENGLTYKELVTATAGNTARMLCPTFCQRDSHVAEDHNASNGIRTGTWLCFHPRWLDCSDRHVRCDALTNLLR